MERSDDPRGRRPNRKLKEQTAQSLIAALLLGTASGCAAVDMQAPVYNARLARPATVVLVQRGETIPNLARRFNVPAEAIIETNGLYAPYQLAHGQRIVIPPAYVAASWHPQSAAQPKARARKATVELETQNELPAPKPRPAIRPTPVKKEVLASPVVVEPGEPMPDPRLEGARFYALGTPRAKPTFEGQGGPEVFTAPNLAEAALVMPRPKPKRDIAEPDLDAAYVPPKKAKRELVERDTDLAYDEKPKASRQVAERDPDAAFDERPIAKGTGRFLWPVKGGKVVSNFGRRGTGVHNDGINIAAEPNTPVKAADTGTVVYAGNELAAYGNLLLVRHANGYVTAYAHNKKLLVGRGDTVSRGDTIALVGSTGDVDRPQLHFEIRKGDRALDPNRYLIRETASR